MNNKHLVVHHPLRHLRHGCHHPERGGEGHDPRASDQPHDDALHRRHLVHHDVLAEHVAQDLRARRLKRTAERGGFTAIRGGFRQLEGLVWSSEDAEIRASIIRVALTNFKSLYTLSYLRGLHPAPDGVRRRLHQQAGQVVLLLEVRGDLARVLEPLPVNGRHGVRGHPDALHALHHEVAHHPARGELCDARVGAPVEREHRAGAKANEHAGRAQHAQHQPANEPRNERGEPHGNTW
eukprot:1178431-Prorocentrum_minimum.AAC.1